MSKSLLPDNWQLKKIEDIAKIIMGQSPPGKTYNPAGLGMPFLQGKAEFGSCSPKHAKYTTQPLKKAPKGSVLISVRAPVGDVNLANIDYCIGRGLAAIYSESQNNTFLYYLLKYLKPAIEMEGTGSTFKAINKTKLAQFIIPLPSIPEQRTIAHILTTIQQAIEATDKVITAAQELKKSLMQHLFTYGPVSLEEAEQIPLKETDIGMIPKHWELTTVKEYSNKLQYGFTASATDKKVGPKILRITDIKEGLVDWDRVPYCECSEVDYQKYSLSEGDILVARIGATTGKTYMVNQIPSPTVFASYLIKIVTSQNVIPEYLYHFFNTPAYWKQINESKEDKLKKGVSASLLSSLTFPKAPFNEQTKVKTMLTIVNKKIYTEQKRKNTLQSLFNSMLHHLMTGKLRVKDLDLNIPEEVAQ